MREIGTGLRIKYRLSGAPSEREAAQWAVRVDALIGKGVEPEDAGRQAADELFEIVPNLVLKAEADTIKALLKQAKEK